MKKLITLLLLLAAFVVPAAAQSQQDLINAYRNGTLTQSQIDKLKSQYDSSSKNVRRTRDVNASGAANNAVVEVTEELTEMPADPQRGVLENRVQGAVIESTNIVARIFGHDLPPITMFLALAMRLSLIFGAMLSQTQLTPYPLMVKYSFQM